MFQSTDSRHAGFSSDSTWAQQLWNLPVPGIQPGSPALAGGFLFTEPPRKFQENLFLKIEKKLPQILPWAFLVAQTVKNPSAMWKTWVRSLGWEDPLEEDMATHSSVLAWRIPMDRGAWQVPVHGVTKSET